MNDPTFVEASRKLAERVMHTVKGSHTEKLEWLFRITTSRRPSPDEIDLLVSTFQAALRRYVDHPELAEQLMTVGESSYDPRLSVTQLAALAAIANALLNTDEVITKN